MTKTLYGTFRATDVIPEDPIPVFATQWKPPFWGARTRQDHRSDCHKRPDSNLMEHGRQTPRIFFGGILDATPDYSQSGNVSHAGGRAIPSNE